MPGAVVNTVHGYREELPRPSIETLLTQKPANLDHENRYFSDTKKMLGEFVVYDEAAQEKPQYSDKKDLAGKVTNREFIRIQKKEIVPPPGYREGTLHRTYLHDPDQRKSSAKKRRNQREAKRQISEVGDQDSSPAVTANK